jgi:hypothetical protein
MKRKFTFTHDSYKSPVIQFSTEDVDYHAEVGNDLSLVVWDDESVSVITGTLDNILKEAGIHYFNDWNEDWDFEIPTNQHQLADYCESTELNGDSDLGFALVNTSEKEVLGQPYNSSIYFH